MGRSPESYHSWPEVVKALDRLLTATRRRRLDLGADCGEAEATRREVAAAAVALLAATAIVAKGEGRR
jgi:hypothetical protein